MQPGPLSILIVEDNEAARNSLSNLLTMRYPEMVVHCSDNGLSGLECFKAYSPDLVVTDISMPALDGISMAAEIKQLNPEVAIIALTSYTDIRFLLKSIEIGIDHYLLKPLVCEKLYAVIDKNLTLISDLSHRKQMEAALLKSQNDLKLANEQLEQRVNERTAELQVLIREQEAFSYSVSHDLRAPLRHMNNFSAILVEEYRESLPAPARDYLDRIRSASRRMGDLIDHLLELSRVGRAQIKVGPVNLSKLASATLNQLQEADPKRLAEISIQKDLTARGDHALLGQLLENLIGNAWKYTSQKPVAHIQFGKTSLSGQPTYFVRDNGAGFDMAYKHNLFEAFQRLHSSEFEGDGIGLATAQRIIHRHGGEIWAEGMVDQGATFYFTLPGHGRPR
jgi:two-component system, sensor histidine kinase and response regulator